MLVLKTDKLSELFIVSQMELKEETYWNFSSSCFLFIMYHQYIASSSSLLIDVNKNR